MRMPSQKLCRALLEIDNLGSPYRREDHQAQEEAYLAAAPELVCSVCGLSSSHHDLETIEARLPAVEGGYASPFRFSFNLRGLSTGTISDATGSVMCLGCFRSENACNPLLPAAPNQLVFGLYGPLSQDQIDSYWRALLAVSIRHPAMRQGLGRGWSLMASEAQSALARGLGGVSSSIGPSEMCTWSALTQEHKWDLFQSAMLDVRHFCSPVLSPDLGVYAEVLARSSAYTTAAHRAAAHLGSIEAAALLGEHHDQPATA